MKRGKIFRKKCERLVKRTDLSV